jgi:hypothetical protein
MFLLNINQLNLLLLTISIICTIIFFVFLFKLINTQKALKKQTAIFNHFLNTYKTNNDISATKESTTVSLKLYKSAKKLYNPMKLLLPIIVVNMIPAIILLLTFPVHGLLIDVLLIFFFSCMLCLTIYIFYLTKHKDFFSLERSFVNSSYQINNDAFLLIREFDYSISPLIQRKAFTILYAFEFLNVSLICLIWV